MQKTDSHAVLHDTFHWLIPTQFHITQACLLRWADQPLVQRRAAIRQFGLPAPHAAWSFAHLAEITLQLAQGLARMGVQPGDRVAVHMGQRAETAAACLAVLSIGAILVPLSTALTPRELSACLRDAIVRLAIVDEAHAAGLRKAQTSCPHLQQIVGLGYEDEATLSWRSLLSRQTPLPRLMPALAEQPAILLYQPRPDTPLRGALLSHAALIGQLPTFVASQHWFPQPDDIFHTTMDWLSPSGLLQGWLPALYFGQTVVATPDPPAGGLAALLTQERITNLQLDASPLPALTDGPPLPTALRAIAMHGAPVPAAHLAACEQALGVAPNTVLNATGAFALLGDSLEKWPQCPGSYGRPYPGHRVAVLDSLGRLARPGASGTLVVNRRDIHGHHDPALPIGYWRQETSFQAQWRQDWWQTGLTARQDETGCFWPA